MKRNVFTGFVAVLIAIGFVTGCIGLDLLYAQKQQPLSGQTNPMEKDFYQNDGLGQGQTLSQKVIYDSENLVCFEDRAVHKFIYRSKHPQTSVKQIKSMLDANPALTRVYVLPVPPRICTENGFDEEKAAYRKFCEVLYETLPAKAALVDALPLLSDHREEYIFFRTEDSWTARGAYYGMEALGEAMKTPVYPLDAYEESMYNSFTGSAKYMDDVWVDKDISFPVDWNYYYLLPHSVNRVEIMRTDGNGKRFCFKKPLITISARNDGTFVDAAYVRAVVDGKTESKTKKGHYILAICDEKGKLLVPYLKDYYDGVYVINVKEDGDFAQDIDSIIQAYHITEVVYAQNACDMGVDGYDKAWQGFAAGEEYSQK